MSKPLSKKCGSKLVRDDKFGAVFPVWHKPSKGHIVVGLITEPKKISTTELLDVNELVWNISKRMSNTKGPNA